MSKKKRRQKNRKKPDASNFMVMDSPFAEMSEETLAELLETVGKDSAGRFTETLAELLGELENVDPVLLLSSFAFYGLTHDGVSPEWDKPIKITQHHVELLQAVLLTRNREDYKFQPVVGNIFPNIQGLLEKLSFFFQFKRFDAFASLPTQAERQKLSIQEYMRLSTQVARNWGYPHQVQNTVIKLFSPLDDSIEARLDIRIEHLVNMCFSLIETIEDRINQHRQDLGSTLRIKKTSSMVKRYSQVFLGGVDDDGFLDFITQNDLNISQVRPMLMSHSDLFLSDLYILNLDDFVNAYSSSVNTFILEGVLDKWSLQFGELRDSNIEHFFMGNPIWEKPLIKNEDGDYFCPIVGIFISFCTELMENLIRDHHDLWQRYEKRRGEFLEIELSELFGLAFPEAKIYRGSQWSDPEDNAKVYENDLLVVIDTSAFVIEAKSGRVRPPSRRGAPSALEDDIEKLIMDASIQANRFIDYVKQNPIHNFDTRRGETNEIDVSHVKYFQPLNVTLDFWGAVSAHIPSLQNAGLASPIVKSVPSMSLSDMEIIFEILTDTAQKIHYFRWRTNLEQQADFEADECDLLVLYVTDRFHDAKMFGNEYSLYFYGESEFLNPYFMQRYHKREILKPARQFTRWWSDILRRLEERHIQGWTELSAMLLELPFTQQKRIEKSFRKPFKRLKKGSKDIYTYAAISEAAISIILLGYRNLSLTERNDIAGRIAQETLEEHFATQAVVVGLDAEREKEDFPYSFLALCFPHLND